MTAEVAALRNTQHAVRGHMALLTTDEIYDWLRQQPTFGRVTDEALHQIAELVEIQAAVTGQVLYKIGQIANKLYIVESGLVNLLGPQRMGRMQIVSRVGPGEVFGVQALLTG